MNVTFCGHSQITKADNIANWLRNVTQDLCVNEDAVLYYTEEEGESLERWLDYIGQDCDVIMLKPNWYIGIDPSDVERTQK